MKVILLQDIKGLGRRSVVVNVSDGHATNFLIPKKLAIIANPQAIKNQEQAEKNLQLQLKKFQDFSRKIKKETIEFKVKTGSKGEIFSPIADENIKQTLAKMGYTDFSLKTPSLKNLGKHHLKVSFPHGIVSEIIINISPDEKTNR